MSIRPITALLLLAASSVNLTAAERASAQTPLKEFPKNLARQHLGSNLFLFDPAKQAFQPTEAAAAWLDDDVSTGWPLMAGKQRYMLALPEPMLLSNFAVSARPTAGTITLYAADEPAAPGDKAWKIVVKSVELNSINDQRLATPFHRSAKYLLIETDVADPGPLYGIYLYGDRSAVSYQLRRRESTLDLRAIFGPHTNDATAISVAGLYAHSTVTFANSTDGFVGWQKAIDDNPATRIGVAPSTNEAGLALTLHESQRLHRVSVMSAEPVAGKLEIFVVPASAAVAVVPAGEPSATAKPATSTSAPLLEGLTPTVMMTFDGASTRQSVDFPAVEGGKVLVRWTSDQPDRPIAISEINAFSDLTLATTEASLDPAAVSELTSAHGYDASKGSGKDFKDYKGLPPPVGEFLPTRSPYLPGSLGFPPAIVRGNPTAVSPPSAVSQ